ncbi:TetR family transcriptional regulator [Verrucosispora sp. WMMA2044]|uniref:TetR family transcriptional regulator n=1 Tax=Verrucosispora sioxanthis TaxID=2499994 RepID=A0A6M1KY79_9ACTN|nr:MULTISPECIES: TetR family transcriptional regulator [Micromonospora]NEE63879.1 TetR family transcriptional regulator [Verrucosispora sioxanthis]NGM12989.1 TetR family transcriptional regulator [Verrucosispora sioxanthis]WBB50948.1 TetR family transcriptional regulator [Verrucosispora sp. WMMA2044]
MTCAETDGTRSRILRAALDLFAEQGYQRTSLRQIAERLRLTKAAILYHFPSKVHLLAALAEPLIRDLEALLDTAGSLPGRQARWTLLEGWVDTMLAHRGPLGMLFHDLALVDRGSTYHRLMQIAMRANEIVAGPDAGRRDRVRAVQAIAMCSDPVVFMIDVPASVLRADMLDGVCRLLGETPPGEQRPVARTTTATDPAAGAAPPGRVGRRRPGRPRSLSPEQVRAARRMHLAGTHSADEIAAEFGVSRATVYRHLDADHDNETITR